MGYSVVFSPVAEKDLTSLSTSIAKRILTKIQVNSEDPRAHSKPLKGQAPPVYSLRVGEYRVLFELDDDRLEMFVLLLRHRSVVYRDF